MPKHRWGLVVLVTALVSVAFLTGGWLNRPEPANSTTNVYQQARLFEDVLDAIRTHYVDSIGETDLYFKATTGIVDHLRDPYSVLLVDDGYRRHNERLSGTSDGLGLTIDLRRGRLVVAAAAPGSPAERDGIAAGDQLVAVNGVATKGWNVERAYDALRGDVGSEVAVLVRRPGVAEPIPHRLTRQSVHVPAVGEGRLLEDGVGVVSLGAVSAGSAAELREAVDSLRARGMTALVLDLRYNPGGLLNQAVDISRLFLGPGQRIGEIRGRTERQSSTYVADSAEAWPDLPVAVLVNGGTASSAEIIAGALQDHDRAVIVGTPTFGKGAVQSTIPLGRNIALKLTTARWHTPSGRGIQRPVQLTDSGPPVFAREDSTAHRSDAGRPLPDASGIVPDILAKPAMPTAAEAAFRRALGGDLSRYRDVLSEYAEDLHASGALPDTLRDATVRVTPAMRRELFRRLGREGLRVPEAVYREAVQVVDREIGDELALEILGEPALRARRLQEDVQLHAAADALRGLVAARRALEASALLPFPGPLLPPDGPGRDSAAPRPAPPPQ